MKATQIKATPTFGQAFAVRAHGTYQIHRNGEIKHYRETRPEKIEEFIKIVGDRVYQALTRFENPQML